MSPYTVLVTKGAQGLPDVTIGCETVANAELVFAEIANQLGEEVTQDDIDNGYIESGSWTVYWLENTNKEDYLNLLA